MHAAWKKLMPAAFLLVLAVGCARGRADRVDEFLDGEVISHDSATGEASVAVRDEETGARLPGPTVCAITEHSEVYLNDKLSPLEVIRDGDDVRLIGYRDPNPLSKRFVVSFAYITRPQTTPQPPDLTALTTRPSSPAGASPP